MIFFLSKKENSMSGTSLKDTIESMEILVEQRKNNSISDEEFLDDLEEKLNQIKILCGFEKEEEYIETDAEKKDREYIEWYSNVMREQYKRR